MRDMEREMRATRQEAAALKSADLQNDYAASKARYAAQRAEYKKFSSAMQLKEDWNRIYMDGLGRI